METTPQPCSPCCATAARWRHRPEIIALWGVPQRADHHRIDCGVTLMVLDYASAKLSRCPVLCRPHPTGQGAHPRRRCCPPPDARTSAASPHSKPCANVRAPAECLRTGLLMMRRTHLVHRAHELRADTVLNCSNAPTPCAALRALPNCWPPAAARRPSAAWALPTAPPTSRLRWPPCLQPRKAWTPAHIARQCGNNRRHCQGGGRGAGS